MVFAIGLGQLMTKMFDQVQAKLSTETPSVIEAYICSIGDLVFVTSKAETVDTQVQAAAEITTSLIVPYLDFCCNDANFVARFFVKDAESNNGAALRITIYKLFKEALFIEGMMNGAMDSHMLNKFWDLFLSAHLCLSAS